jgi:hypothetical protein
VSAHLLCISQKGKEIGGRRHLGVMPQSPWNPSAEDCVHAGVQDAAPHAEAPVNIASALK